jgi:hypothetical protein
MGLPDGAASIWVKATRLAVLDSNGFVDPGVNTYTTESVVKATITPVLETGDDIAVKNASGNLSAWGKHGDMVKYYTVSLELATPDPALIQMMAGGLLYSAVGSALGAPTGLTVTNLNTGSATSKLAANTVYGYRVTQYNQYGESVAANDVNLETGAGLENVNVIGGLTTAAGAVGVKVYGRTIGGEQYIGSYLLIGSQATSAASGTGVVTKLTVTALTKSVPVGTEFQIAGDTNTQKIVFTTTAFAPEGAVELKVRTLQASVTTTIAAGAIKQVYVDEGKVVPNGNVPATDTTAGPGPYTGYQAPALGSVANEAGVSMEFFEEAIVGGYQDTGLPFYRHVLPRVTNMHKMPHEHTNANQATILEGQAFQNPNWGTGPALDFQFDSTKVFSSVRCGRQIVPPVGLLPVAAI